MPTTSDLTGSHRRTYETIFQHPISHNLEWRAVRSLLEKIGEVAEQPNGHLRVSRHGQTLVLPTSRTKDVASSDEVMNLRHFLERSEAAPLLEVGPEGDHWLLVINHHEARIYRSEMSGSVPQQIRPQGPKDGFPRAPNSGDFSRGQEKPDPATFFTPVAEALQGAGPILIFGSGTGTGSEQEQLVTWLKAHHPQLAARVIGCLTIDEHHLTEGQLLAKAREFYRALSATAA